MLWKCTTDSLHLIQWIKLPIQEDVRYQEQLIQILRREIQVLQNRYISFVKVIWDHHKEEETTWKLKFEIFENTFNYLIISTKLYFEFWDEIYLIKVGCKTLIFHIN